MARSLDRGLTRDFVFYGVVFGGGYIAYNMALNGTFGLAAQQWAREVQAAVKVGAVQIPGSNPGGTPGGGGSGRCSIAATGNLAVMRMTNPNIAQQINEWKALRRSIGESDYDWASFRQHLSNLGAPDPGYSPPPEFCS